jgi:hypothetical protein
MIKIENIVTPSPEWMEGVVRGMRNPKNSWKKSDSYITHIENAETLNTAPYQFFIGENDMGLMKNLASAGSDHRKYLRQMPVMMDITAPLYWWKEYDTYKVGTVSNSCSTMHKIHAKAFDRDDFSHDRMSETALNCLDNVIAVLEETRQKYLETKDRAYWNDMIQLLPSSYNQMRTCTMNYENFINMYSARKNHKLTEWHDFCKLVESLPWFMEIYGG